MPRRFSAALLAGGRSTRMGADKAFLDWHGQPLWRLQLQKLLALAPRQTFIAARAEQNFAALVQNSHEWAGQKIICLDDPVGENCGPVGAIARCLRVADGPLLVLATDLPLMTVDFLRAHLVAAAEQDIGLFFHSEQGCEALAAVYTAAMLPFLDDALRTGQFALHSVIATAESRGCCEARKLAAAEARLFTNINTAAEAERVLDFQN